MRKLQIHISPPDIKYTLPNRFKTWLWNLILPPQVRLYMPDKPAEEPQTK